MNTHEHIESFDEDLEAKKQQVTQRMRDVARVPRPRRGRFFAYHPTMSMSHMAIFKSESQMLDSETIAWVETHEASSRRRRVLGAPGDMRLFTQEILRSKGSVRYVGKPVEHAALLEASDEAIVLSVSRNQDMDEHELHEAYDGVQTMLEHIVEEALSQKELHARYRDQV